VLAVKQVFLLMCKAHLMSQLGNVILDLRAGTPRKFQELVTGIVVYMA
jgi:hypothetical protein